MQNRSAYFGGIMNNKLAGCLRTGDKIKLNNKEVTFNYLNNNYIKIQNKLDKNALLVSM